MRILVLGAYGLIGTYITKSLIRDGHVVTGLGRNVQQAEILYPQVKWVTTDLQNMTNLDQWIPYLDDVDVVINCSGDPVICCSGL